jgi:hypothetical protein
MERRRVASETCRMHELVGRADAFVELLLQHAPQLKLLQLRRPTVLDVLVFEFFLERTGVCLKNSPWYACIDHFAFERCEE